ncbi:MAG: PD-(D/E)XK nuclease family protein [Candidatus Aenigmarchaeota archaeon]|nr:PD-(D/E)XK nuclease family protein [Candidatus Aenigmarchaeota archaeon]
MESMRTINIRISDFASAMGYCQYIAPNIYELGLKRKLSRQLLAGKALHERLEAEDKLVPREEATKEQLADAFFDLDFTREGISVCVERVNQNNFRYNGRTDKVIRYKGDVYIIDDKTTSKESVPDRLYLDRLLQLGAYCEGFIRTYSPMISFNRLLFRVIHRNPAGEVIQEKSMEYGQEARAILVENFNKFEGLINKTMQPQHHNNPNRCRPCGFFDACKWRVESPALPKGV